MPTIESRLASLESTVRLQRFAIINLVLVGVVAAGAGAISRPVDQDEVRTKRLVILDDDGKQIGYLGKGDEGGSFLTLDSKAGDSKGRIKLGATPTECMILASSGNSLQALRVSDRVSMYAAKGSDGDSIVIDSVGEFPLIRIDHKDAKDPSIVISSSPKTGPLVILRDTSGKPIWSAPK